MIAKDLEYQMEMLNTLYLTLNFEDLYKLAHKYTSDGQEESSKKAKEDLVTKETVSHLKPADLEQIGKDFLKTYKSKVEAIIKDIRNNISTSTFQMDSQRKQQKSQTRKELTTRLTRILMLHFSTYIEIVSVGRFGDQNQFLKSMVSNSSQRNQVILDLRAF